jgi:hypothetical protein
MPRLVFHTIEEFSKWIKDFVRVDRHAIYFTTRNEVIIAPLISTRPINFAYMKIEDSEDLKIIKQVLPNGINTYSIDSFDWRWQDREVRERRYFLEE